MQDDRDFFVTHPPTPAELDDVFRDDETPSAPATGSERSLAAAALAEAMSRYGRAQGASADTVLLGMAIANGLYNPEKLKALGAPREIVKALAAARDRAARKGRRLITN